MEAEVRTRSTEELIQIVMTATARMWEADNTGPFSHDALLWEEHKTTAEFATVVVSPKRWQLFEAPSTDSAFWRLVLRESWHAAPAMPNGETGRVEPWDVVIEPDDDAAAIEAKLEQARTLLHQAIADGEFNDDPDKHDRSTDD